MGVLLYLWLLSFFIGYIVCYFVITPLLLKKHGKRGFFQALIWESLQSENHLKDLASETGDKAVVITLRVARYSKITIVFSLLLFVLFAILNVMSQP